MKKVYELSFIKNCKPEAMTPELFIVTRTKNSLK